MTVLDSTGIASWQEPDRPRTDREASDQSIDTESRIQPDLKWEKCFDALLEVWDDPSKREDGTVVAPTKEAVEAAIQWLLTLRENCPAEPPTLITCEPAGGVIVERRDRTEQGIEFATELTYSNDGTAEVTVYKNGRIIEMRQVPFTPPAAHGSHI